MLQIPLISCRSLPLHPSLGNFGHVYALPSLARYYYTAVILSRFLTNCLKLARSDRGPKRPMLGVADLETGQRWEKAGIMYGGTTDSAIGFGRIWLEIQVAGEQHRPRRDPHRLARELRPSPPPLW
jgi:hypothetical protein